MVKKSLIPPDGGWGWMIMIAYALNNLVLIPIIQNFGLIFKDAFGVMDISATDGAIIITTNASFGMIMALVNGPLLNRYGYRKVAVAGSVFVVSGLLGTAFSTKFPHFLVSYGLIASFGINITMASYALALNTYFLKNRGKATGFTFTITGFGPILMPQLVSFMLDIYSIQGVMLILTSIVSHSFISSCLLQPVKWHMKEETVEVDEEQNYDQNTNKEEEEETRFIENVQPLKRNLKRSTSILDSNPSFDHDAETQSIYGYDTLLVRNNSVSSRSTVERSKSLSLSDSRSMQPIEKKWASTTKSDDLENSIPLHNDGGNTNMETPGENQPRSQALTERPLLSSVYNPDLCVKREKEQVLTKFLNDVVNFFDLTLLSDPKFVIIMIGMSLVIYGELNFVILTPFILDDIGLSTQEIATFVSVLSGADLTLRFISPFVGDYFKKSPKIMYMISLFLLASTRFFLLIFTSFGALLGIAVVLGIGKGIRTVYMTLVIPSYVPLNKLASASGLQMVFNGLLILAGGPFLGVIRDSTGSYATAIYVMNTMTICTLVMWTVEIFYSKIKDGKKTVVNT